MLTVVISATEKSPVVTSFTTGTMDKIIKMGWFARQSQTYENEFVSQ